MNTRPDRSVGHVDASPTQCKQCYDHYFSCYFARVPIARLHFMDDKTPDESVRTMIKVVVG